MRKSAMLILAGAFVAASGSLAFADQGPTDRDDGGQLYQAQPSAFVAPVRGQGAYASTKHARAVHAAPMQSDGWDKARIQDSYENGEN